MELVDTCLIYLYTQTSSVSSVTAIKLKDNYTFREAAFLL